MSEDGTTATEEKPRRTWTAARREAEAERRANGIPRIRKDRTPEARPARPEPSEVAEEVVADAVANVKALGGLIAPLAPHVGVALAGVEDSEGRVIVRSRADMVSDVLLEQARRNPRLLKAIGRFNALFESMEVLEAATGVVAAVALDLKMADPRLSVKYGKAEFPVFAPVLGDVIEFVGQQEAARQEAADVGRTFAKVQERRAQAEAERAEAAALLRTTSDDGQTVIPGGVEST